MISKLRYSKIKNIIGKKARWHQNYEDIAHDHVIDILTNTNNGYAYQQVYFALTRKSNIYKEFGTSIDEVQFGSYNMDTSLNGKFLYKDTKVIIKKNRKRLNKNIGKFLDLFLIGNSYSEIGKQYGCSKQFVNRELNKLFKLCREQMKSEDYI